MSQITPSKKSCSTCHEVKELTQFNANKNAKDGRHAICKECNKAKAKARRAAAKGRLVLVPAREYVDSLGLPSFEEPAPVEDDAYTLTITDLPIPGLDTPHKTCSKCREEKSLDAFPNDKSRKDGKSYVCKECRKTRR